MARDATPPLTPAEAKARLREASSRASITGWTRRNPYNAVLLALTAGLVVGGSRRSTDQLSITLINALASLLRTR